MKLAVELGRPNPNDLNLNVEWVQHAERLGVDMAFSAEAWWSDAVTPLAYLADKTSTIKLATGIMQTTARTPAMTAMTALTLHDLTGGRFILGLGASGPQVVEGLHSTRYNPALSRLRETINICRMIFAGEKKWSPRTSVDLEVHDAISSMLRYEVLLASTAPGFAC